MTDLEELASLQRKAAIAGRISWWCSRLAWLSSVIVLGCDIALHKGWLSLTGDTALILMWSLYVWRFNR